jgi:hypothetical protein
MCGPLLFPRHCVIGGRLYAIHPMIEIVVVEVLDYIYVVKSTN